MGETHKQEKVTARSFFAVPPQQLTQNYQNTKITVADWLEGVGKDQFYPRLAEIRGSKSFE